MATISDVSRRAGVSTATVSRAINKPDLVDKKTLLLVNQAIEELGYRPNQIARGLASRSSRTIGVVINNFASPYYGAMLDGVEKSLRKLQFKTIAESSHEASEGETDALLSLFDRQCEVVILHSDNLTDCELRRLFEEHPSCVLMNRFLPSYPERCIYLDNEMGGVLAAQYLLSKGHERFAMISGPSGFYQAIERGRGFQEALANAGYVIDGELIIEGDFKESSGQAAMLDLLDRDKPFTALFCHNDEMAAGALSACLEKGLRVPEDISIIGFDDIIFARYLTPKLTTIRQPLAEIGDAAARLAHTLAVTGGSTGAIERVFEAEVIERGSVAEPSLR